MSTPAERVPALKHEGTTPHGLDMYSPEKPGGGFAYALVGFFADPSGPQYLIEARWLRDKQLSEPTRLIHRPKSASSPLPASTVTRLLREHLARGGEQR